MPEPATVYLSDLTPTASVNGWGPYERDRSNGENGATDGLTLTINGTTYAKGLGVHAASSLTYALGGLYSRFQSYIGIDDEILSSRGSVIFRVLADGTEIFRSATLTGATDAQLVDLDVAGRQTLQLIVDTADGSDAYDHANWADAKLISTPTVPPVDDGTGPTAVLTASGITAAPGGLYTFTVRYDDPSGVSVASIDNADIQVTGPNGYSQSALRLATTPAGNATSVIATYSIPAPGGTWDIADNGAYQVSLLPGAVSDSFGNGTAAAVLGSFAVNIADFSTVYLSDLTPTASVNGWGPYERDRSNGENGATDGGTLTINGTTYAKGLGVHAASSLTYALGGLYSRFQSYIGIDDEILSSRGSVIFRVLADGTEIFRSATLTGATDAQLVDLDVAGRQTLQLIVDTADGSDAWDHANWADAKLISTPTVPPVDDGTGPTAVLTASGITAAPGGLYTFTVRYDDPSGVSVASIDNADIQVTGPNGYSQLAIRVATTPASNATSVTATYSIAAPGGTWDIADNGAYQVSLLPGAVSDSFGNGTGAAALGSFAVNIADFSTVYLSDLTPTASVNGWGPYERDRSNGENGATDGGTLTINGTIYAKGLGVHAASSLTYALGGLYSRFQSYIGIDDEILSSRGSVIFRVLADGTEIFQSATLTGATDAQLVDLDVAGRQTLQLIVDNADGSDAYDHANWADAKLISTPTVPPVDDGTGPTAVLTASGITAAPGGLYTFTVRYDDPSGVSVASIDNADIQVTGPNGYSQSALRLATTPAGNANSVTATYSIPAPGGTWDIADNGAYQVSLLAGAVSDSKGNGTAAAVLGSFAVNITTAPPPLPSGPAIFAPLVELNTGESSHGVSSGDVNADGIIDLVVANSGFDSVSVLLGLGDGTFASTVNYGVVGDQPKSVVLADLNGDGLLDLLTANQGSGSPATGTVSILYNNPSLAGTFLPAVVVEGVSGSHEIASADVDLDGDPDIAVSGWGGSIIRVLLNNGSGVFSTSNSYIYNVGSNPHSLQFGDFNNDGRPDLAVANTNSNSVTILLNGVGSAIGTYTPAATYFVGSGPHSIRVGDLNGDGQLDLATANENANTISLLLGRGDGTFTSTASLSTGSVPKGIAIADVNGDGLMDVLTANSAGNYPNNSNNPGGNTISILYGEGQGLFSAPVSLTTGNTPFAINVADFNDDGLLDLATANWFGNGGIGSVGILLNTPIQPSIDDGTGPTATLTASGITAVPGGLYTFTVRYDDPSGVSAASIDNADIQVTGPNGYSQSAIRVSTTYSATSVTTTYSIPSPGGSWDIADNGSYQVSILPAAVTDRFGNATAAAALGSFAVNLSTTPPPQSSSIYLSDLTPTASVNGWGPYERDRSNGEEGATDGGTLTINGTTYAKGLGVHAASSLTYALGGLYSRFQSYIGIDDEILSSRGSVVFRVLADGTEIFRSATLTGATDPQFVDLDVAGRQTLQLFADTADGSDAHDHANWADAKLISGDVFRLSSNDLIYVSEGQGEAMLVAVRSGSNASAATLQFTTNEIVGSATSGVDFIPPVMLGFNTGQISFLAGQAEQTIRVAVTNDNLQEENELFAIGIQNPSAGSLGAPRTARILIVDDDGVSRISLAEPSVTVSESEDFATITLLRSGDRSQTATVQLTINNGTATAGIDYGSIGTTVTFAAGSFLQTVKIPIIDDLNIESSESFQVQIENPVGASLEGHTTATVNILDNDRELGNLQRQSFVSGLNRPTTFEWLPEGNTMLVAEKAGVVRVVVNGAVRDTPLIDLSTIVNDTGDRGLLSLAVHPSFGPAFPYVYVAYTYDPPQTAGLTGNAGPDGDGNRPARVEKLTVDPTTLTVTGREVILGKNSLWQYTSSPDVDSTGTPFVLPSGIVNGTTITADNAPIDVGYQDNIPSLEGIQNLNIRDYLAGDSTSHTIGDMEFGSDGYLYVTNGDGTSYNFQDPRTVRVQDIANLSGKLLRIDPITGQGVASNPFFNGDAESNQSKVFYSGLRNSFRFSVDPVTGFPVMGDVGWNSWEEINTAAPGANFGWPYLEGPDRTGGYSTLDSAQAFYANSNVNPNSPSTQPAVQPILQLSHTSPDNFSAVMVGDFYNSNTLIYGDLVSGRLYAATLDANRQVTGITQFDNGASYVVDVKLGPDGYLYGSSLYSVGFGPGEILRWQPA